MTNFATLWRRKAFTCLLHRSTLPTVSSGTAALLRLHRCNAGSPSSQLQARGPYTSRLNSRGVLRFEGPDTVKFLQGLVSNDIYRLVQEPSPLLAALPTPNQPVAQTQPLYTVFLNPQGRFLFDIFLYRHAPPSERLDKYGSSPGTDATPVLFGDADASEIGELLNHLKKHKLHAKVDFEDVSKDLSVWQRYSGSLTHENLDDEDDEIKNLGWGGAHDPSAQASVEATDKGYRWCKDPRLGSLGFRAIFPSNSVPPMVEADKEVDEIYYVLWRFEQGVPEGCHEILKEKANPLEYNLAWLNAISFEKGCYVGQELVARTHHRGVIRKRLMPINFVDEHCKEAQDTVTGSGAEIIERSTQKKVGDVIAVLGSRGLGMIRLEAAQKDPSHLTIKNLDGIHVKHYRPKWWHADWCPEELQQAAIS